MPEHFSHMVGGRIDLKAAPSGVKMPDGVSSL